MFKNQSIFWGIIEVLALYHVDLNPTYLLLLVLKISQIPKLEKEGKTGADDLKSTELCVICSESAMLDAPLCDSWREFCCDPDAMESVLEAKLVWLKSMSNKSSLERDLGETMQIKKTYVWVTTCKWFLQK